MEAVNIDIGTIINTTNIIRFLAPDEYFRVSSIFLAENAVMPAPEYSKIAVAESPDGDIIGMVVLQPILHLEPFWIHPDHRGNGLWKAIADLQLESISNLGGAAVYAFLPDEQTEKIVTRLGFTVKNWKAAFKEVK